MFQSKFRLEYKINFFVFTRNISNKSQFFIPIVCASWVKVKFDVANASSNV
jgi:hypothetical protein